MLSPHLKHVSISVSYAPVLRFIFPVVFLSKGPIGIPLLEPVVSQDLHPGARDGPVDAEPQGEPEGHGQGSSRDQSTQESGRGVTPTPTPSCARFFHGVDF